MKPNYQDDAFSGTAEAYLRFRVPYPREMLAEIARLVRADSAGRMIDLASGPGRIALALADSFAEVVAVDLEREMIEVGRREATRRNIANVRWQVGRAEEFSATASGFQLITIGEAFHRLDRPLIARRCREWLVPGGGIASLGSYGMLAEIEPWHRVVMDVARRWVGRSIGPKTSDGKPPPVMGPEAEEQVLRECGFVEVGSHPYLVPISWTCESITGYLFSTSFCSRRVLGSDADAFAADLKAALLAFDPTGVYRENLQFGFTFGRKPRLN